MCLREFHTHLLWVYACHVFKYLCGTALIFCCHVPVMFMEYLCVCLRHKWDDDMLSWDVVERLDRNSDVFHYVLNTMAPHPPRHFMVIR